MGGDASGHDQGEWAFPDCIGNPGISTFTEGPSTVITFDDDVYDGLEV